MAPGNRQDGAFGVRPSPAIRLLVHAQVVLDRGAAVGVEHGLQPSGHVPHHHQPGQEEERTWSGLGLGLRLGSGLALWLWLGLGSGLALGLGSGLGSGLGLGLGLRLGFD